MTETTSLARRISEETRPVYLPIAPEVHCQGCQFGAMAPKTASATKPRCQPVNFGRQRYTTLESQDPRHGRQAAGRRPAAAPHLNLSLLSRLSLVSSPDPFLRKRFAHVQKKRGRGGKERVWGIGLPFDGSWNVNCFHLWSNT